LMWVLILVLQWAWNSKRVSIYLSIYIYICLTTPDTCFLPFPARLLNNICFCTFSHQGNI
jgi:hypothetical protein